MARLISRAGLQPGRVFAAVLIGGLGGLVLWCGLALLAVHPAGRLASNFPRHIGTYALLCAVPALLAGIWLGRDAWRQRSGKAPVMSQAP